MILKVFHLIAEVNETKHLVLHESCECKCALNESVCIHWKNGIMMNVGMIVKN